MGKFTDQQRKLLVSNKNIQKVTKSNIQFTAKFKQRALDQYAKGKTPEEIFTSAGIDLSLFGEDYARKSIFRWRLNFEKDGSQAFSTEKRGKGSTGRPRGSRNFKTEAEELSYLRAENEFLKKLHALGNQYQKKKSSR